MSVSAAYDPNNPISVTVSGGIGPKGNDGAAGAVFSVNGLTGTVTLTALAVSAASAVHTHTTADITNFAAAAAAASPVQSVNNKTGVIALTAADLTAASSTHTHDASAVQAGTLAAARLPLATTTAVGAVSVTSGLSVTAAGALSANVRSVAGRTGDISLTVSDISGGVVSALNGLSGALAIAAGSNITVAAGGTTVSISSTASGGSGAGVSSIAGLTGTVTITAFGLATSTSGSVLTLDARPVRATPAAITASQDNYNPGSGDIFRLSSGSTNTLNITGLSTAAMSRESLLINVSTHTSSTLTLKHQNTNSTAAARIISPWAGDVNLPPNGGAAVVVYDDTDSRWRVI